MNILMSSIVPLFPGKVMGGASKHLQSVAEHLGSLGHMVRIICTQHPESMEPFTLAPNVEVLPLYRFKQPFPQPYETPAFNIASIIQDLGDHLGWADRFYLHDGEVIFPYVYSDVPTVVSLRDCVYPETWQGAFLHQADAMILISQYTKDYFAGTVGRFFPEAVDRITVIPNGFDWDTFKPTPPDRILDYVDVDPTRHRIVVHPHRPEASKGILQTIEVVDRLVHKYGNPNIRVLVPEWIGLDGDPMLQELYEEVQGQIKARGLEENFVFHGWIPHDLMPEYLSLGAVTLALGSFVETFGNSVYESLGCGTPTIAAKISSHREILPDDLLDKVDFDTPDITAAIATEIIQTKRRTSPQTMAYLHEHYSREQQVAAYADVILNAQKLPPPQYHHAPIDFTQQRFKLASWVYLSEHGFYHDYRAGYTDLPALVLLAEQYPAGFSVNSGVDPSTLETWLRDGFIVLADES